MSNNDALAVILSFPGTKLTDRERAFVKEANPFGFIFFAQNCETPEQMKALSDDLKTTLGRDCPILIDQEGGRVQRMKPPIWRHYPAAQTLGAKAENNINDALEDVRFTILQMAQDFRETGVNVNCAPVLDVLSEDTHDAIGDRAFSENPDIVARLGLSVCRNLLASGITPVMKHMPGQGRANLDSHHDLPRVSASRQELETDFKPFREVSASDSAPGIWGMVAHIVYEDIDPDCPSSVSQTVINDIIRGSIGFDGLLLSDDLNMNALKDYGDPAQRCKATLDAGCDVALYCHASLKEMEKIAESVPKLSPQAQSRLQKSAEYIRLAA